MGTRRLSFLFLLVGCVACGDSEGSTSDPSGGTGAGSPTSGPGGTNATMAPASGSTTTTGSGTGGEGPVSDVHLVGRYDQSNGNGVATWSGSSALARFTGSAVSVRLSGGSDIWFEIVLDGTSVGRFITSGGDQLYPLAADLAPGEHVIEIVRRNEGFFGPFAFVGFEVEGGALVPSPWPYAHRIEFIGDSLTCGYGIEGPNESCNFTGDTESAFSTYAMTAARDLNAAAHLICYSGKGVHQNYGGDLNEPMPVLYPQTLTGAADPPWDPSDFPADAVVINLGTNDFSAALDEGAFVADYVALLTTVRQRHPSAYILGVTWAHWGGGNEALVTDALAQFGDANSGTLQFSIDPNDGLGCDYHTNVVTNGKLGVLLRDTLEERLGW